MHITILLNDRLKTVTETVTNLPQTLPALCGLGKRRLVSAVLVFEGVMGVAERCHHRVKARRRERKDTRKGPPAALRHPCPYNDPASGLKT